MTCRKIGVAPCLVALAVAACAPSGAPAAGDAREVVRAAQREVVRSAECAAELERAAERDPAAVARALRIEPARLAPHGGPAVAPVRAEIAERLWDARADAAAASALVRCADPPDTAPDASRRAARSLAGSGALCQAAESIRGEAIARTR